MAKRDKKFREDVLRLDDYRCQICGFDGHDLSDRSFLEADHVVNRGMGGVPSRDARSNGITLCKKCHHEKTNELWNIAKWDRNDIENGLVVVYADGSLKPRDEIFFYKKRDLEMLQKELEVVSSMARANPARAKMFAHIWKNYSLLGSRSPQELVASVGFDANEAEREARAAIFVESEGLEWPNGLNTSKVLLIMESSEYARSHNIVIDDLQSVMDLAVDMSYSDLMYFLTDNGYLPDNASRGGYKYYLRIPVDAIKSGAVKIYYAINETVVPRSDMELVARIGKVIAPCKARKGKLTYKDGLLDVEIPYTKLTGDEDG